jgi:hypothetical protein
MFNSYVDLEPRQPFPIEYLEPLSLFWVDGGIRKAMDSGNEWALPEKYATNITCHLVMQRVQHLKPHTKYPDLVTFGSFWTC